MARYWPDGVCAGVVTDGEGDGAGVAFCGCCCAGVVVCGVV
jgi:hypothetical protein